MRERGQGRVVGTRFVMRADTDGVLPWGHLREKIRARMAERDVAVDPDTGRLEILRGLVRAHIDSVPEIRSSSSTSRSSSTALGSSSNATMLRRAATREFLRLRCGRRSHVSKRGSDRVPVLPGGL